MSIYPTQCLETVFGKEGRWDQDKEEEKGEALSSFEERKMKQRGPHVGLEDSDRHTF